MRLRDLTGLMVRMSALCAVMAVTTGTLMTLIPIMRLIMACLVISAGAWALLPRRWFAAAEAGTRRIVFLFVCIRPWVPFALEALTGEADAYVYHTRGQRVAAELTATGIASSQRHVPGTGFVDLMVGHLYEFGVDNRFVVYQLFNWLAAMGLLLFWLGTRHLVQRRETAYVACVLLAPTLVLWNSLLGKDALLAFAIGCVAAGTGALAEARLRRGTLLLGVGLSVAALVRPHVGILLILSALGGLLIARPLSAPRKRSRIPAVGVAIVGAIVIFPSFQALINPAEEVSLVDAAYTRAENTADVGGRSSFGAAPVRSITGIPSAALTVLFRPLPWEATSLLQLVVSIEALAMGSAVALALVRIARRHRKGRLPPLVAMALAYSLLFCLAFASIGNFGLLARQRAQLFPFLILLVFVGISRRTAPASPKENSHFRSVGRSV